MSKVNISLYGNPDPSTISFKNKVICVEGIDGSGKSSLIDSIRSRIEERDKISVFVVRQPGTGTVGEITRNLIKDPDLNLDPDVKVYLLAAARRDLMLQLLRYRESNPDSFIIFDRHVDSTWVYQGAEGADEDLIESLDAAYQWSYASTEVGPFDNLIPDLLIYLDVEVGVARSRLFKGRSKPDTYDQKGPDFFKKCKDRYNILISDYRTIDPDQAVVVVNANKSEDEVFNYVKPYLGL